MTKLTREQIFEAELKERLGIYKKEGYNIQDKNFRESVSKNIIRTFNKVMAKWLKK